VVDPLPLKIWFAREILAHEAALMRYLTRTWPRRHEIHDLRQEIYVRIYEAAAKARPTAPKSFLFTTARNLMADRVRRSRIVSIEAVGDLGVLNVMVDEVSPERRLDARQDLKRLAHALDLLPPKCREVVWLRRVAEISQKEVAKRLGISERTVEAHLLKGMRHLADAFLAETAPEPAADRPGAAERQPDRSESEHGQQQKN
jgi:RNA polymerase sigma-70 factor (ECF subfamily)